MATRFDVQARREALHESLKKACQSGDLPPGVMLPSVRELGEQYGVSANVVFGVIQTLTEAGMLYTVPRVGAFVGRPQRDRIEPYVMVVPYHTPHQDNFWVQAQSGFEDRIAQLGGHSIVLMADELQALLVRGDLPPLSGFFESEGAGLSEQLQAMKLPRVHYTDTDESHAADDVVGFDNAGGGAQATHHLRQNGHSVIAYLAVHTPEDPRQLPWSHQRETGWRRAMRQVGADMQGLTFYPPTASGSPIPGQEKAGYDAAKALVGRTDITAVVVANTHATLGMFEAFREADWPAEHWPAVVCFDASPQVGGSVVSYLRLPWEELGREAAQLLWERRTGRLSGPPVRRPVQMRLVPRLSCRPVWAKASGLAQSQATALAGRVGTREPAVPGV